MTRGHSTKIYTDGACSGNPGPGGWGAVLIRGEKTTEFSGGSPETTNNRMELKAAIEGLKEVTKTEIVTVYTDSVYVKDGITQWLPNWKKRGWQTASKKPVKNKDLWEELDGLVQEKDVSWEWVKGHSGIPENERADQLARNAIVTILMEAS